MFHVFNNLIFWLILGSHIFKSIGKHDDCRFRLKPGIKKEQGIV